MCQSTEPGVRIRVRRTSGAIAETLALPGSGLVPLAGPGSCEVKCPSGDSPILVVGPPRSGTTWLGALLARARGSLLVHEPENTLFDPWAAMPIGSRNVFLPVLHPDESAPLYAEFWRFVFRGGRRAKSKRAAPFRLVRGPLMRNPRYREWAATSVRANELVWRFRRNTTPAQERRVIVKSVFAAFAAEWVYAQFSPRVVVILRDPLNTLASWKEMGFTPHPDPADPRISTEMGSDRDFGPSPTSASWTALTAWAIAVQMTKLMQASQRNQDWIVVRHEELTEDPITQIRRLYARLDLPWGDEVANHIAASNVPGKGYQLTRRWADLRDSWRGRLTDDEVAEADRVLSTFNAQLIGYVTPSSSI